THLTLVSSSPRAAAKAMSDCLTPRTPRPTAIRGSSPGQTLDVGREQRWTRSLTTPPPRCLPAVDLESAL
ncbi:unnamed protein product, partial [Polarella glacialis]